MTMLTPFPTSHLIPSLNPLPSPTPDEPNRLFIDGEEYLEASNLARPVHKGAGKKISDVWKLGVQLQQVDDGA